MQNGTICLCGAADGDPMRSYSGAVSHLSLWNTVLTPAQILNLYRTVVVSTATTFGAPANAPAGAQQVAATMTAAAPVYSASDTSSMQMPAPSAVRCWPGRADCDDSAHGVDPPRGSRDDHKEVCASTLSLSRPFSAVAWPCSAFMGVTAQPLFQDESRLSAAGKLGHCCGSGPPDIRADDHRGAPLPVPLLL